jgi:hypothetical protein
MPGRQTCSGSSIPNLLPLSALLLLGRGAGDRFGRARLLVIGTLLFGVDLAALDPKQKVRPSTLGTKTPQPR